MGYEQAWMLAGVFYLGVHPTPNMREQAFDKFARVCRSGVLGDVKWHKRHDPSGHFKHLQFLVKPKLTKEKPVNYEDVADWFNKKNAIEIKGMYE